MRGEKMDILHDKQNKIIAPLSKNLQNNIDLYEALFVDCNDVVKRKLQIGGANKTYVYISYIDVMIDRFLIEEAIVSKLVTGMNELPFENSWDYIRDKALGSADIKELITMEQLSQAVLSGETIIMIDGYDKGLMIASRGFPNRGVQSPEIEVTLRGPKDGFSEALRINTVLIRRRIRDTKLKVKQTQVGIRSRTDVALMYIEDIVRDELLDDIEKRLSSFEIDGILDSGMLEQILEKKWYSPFPQFQATERPDKAASAILEGRIAVVVDNSPMVLLLPTTLNCFFQASDDYYNRVDIIAFTRLLRFVAAFLATAIPGFYIAVTNFHPEMLPTSLILSFQAAREGVPFPVVIEIILMELSFELLREAGIRLPGPMGSTVGIVGGLIVGQAAVAANLVSPIIVILVSITAISTFAIPNEGFASAFRIIKFLIIILSALLGLYGFLLGSLIVLIHLSNLKSFDIPYLMPYVAANVNNFNDKRDSIIRFPIFMQKERPIFAKQDEKIRMRKKGR